MPVDRPRLLVTGFGPFPGAPENPTETLVNALAEANPVTFGAGSLDCVVLPTEYRRSWTTLRRVLAEVRPDVAVHFGLAARADAIQVERMARNRIDPTALDAAGHAPRSGEVRSGGPAALAASLPAEAIVAALQGEGISAALSDDAGAYVCNATLYRSLYNAPPGRRVGFVHVPDAKVLATAELLRAATVLLRAATRAGAERPLP